MNPIRVTAFVFIAASSVLVVLDVIENLVSSTWQGMSLGRVWATIAPGSLVATQGFFERNISVLLWHKFLLPLLTLPIWSDLLALGLIMLLTSRRIDD